MKAITYEVVEGNGSKNNHRERRAQLPRSKTTLAAAMIMTLLTSLTLHNLPPRRVPTGKLGA